MLLSNLEALAMSSFLIVIRVFIVDLVSPLHVLVLLVRNSLIFIIRLSALFMCSAVDLLLPHIFYTFLLLEVILISELLDKSISILITSISPNLIRLAAVLELAPPGLLLLIRHSLLLFSLELTSVVVSLPVVHAAELDFSSPFVGNVSALLGRFH